MLQMTEFMFQSACAPVFVPIDHNNNIAFEVIPKYYKYLSDNGITTLFVNGGCGEFSSLTVEERKLVLEKWIEVSSSDTQILVNIGSSNYLDTVDLAHHALKFNIYGLVVVPPYYMPVINEEDLLSYLTSIVKVLVRPIHILYYHIPMLTKANIDLSKFVTLVQEKQFKALSAIKYTHSSRSDLFNLMETIKVTRSHIKVFCGFEPLINECIRVGVNGCVLAFVNINPQKINEIFKNLASDCQKKAETVETLFAEIIDFSVIHKVQIMGLLKLATELCSGIPIGPMRPPYAISKHHSELLQELLVKSKLIDN